MSKRLTKLARAKSSKTVVDVKSTLNCSDEDFKSVVKENKPQNKEPEEPVLSTNIVNTDVAQCVSQKCHFCGKLFKEGQELTRLSHLKSCGNNLGIGTEELLKIRQLEERQAEEWKALNLPKATNVSRNKTSILRTTRLRNDLSFGDPNLEMALALSASMAGQEDVKTEETTQCWLPQPPPEKISKKPFKSKAKTTLEVRTDDERSKQITEAVTQILSSSGVPIISGISKFSVKSGVVSKMLLDLQCSSCLWKAAALEKAMVFYLDFFQPFRRRHQKNECISVSENNQTLNLEDVDGVVSDWANLLKTGLRSDLTIITKDEVEIKAHSLVLFARFPTLLKSDIIEENGSNSVLPWLEVGKSAALSFLTFVYSGKLSIDTEDLAEGQILAKKYPEAKKWSEFVSMCRDDKDHNLSNLLEVLEEESLSSENESTDLFDDSHDEGSSRPLKRKPSFSTDEMSKRSKIDEDSFGSLPPNATVYSRRFSSPIDDILLEDSPKKEFSFKKLEKRDELEKSETWPSLDADMVFEQGEAEIEADKSEISMNENEMEKSECDPKVSENSEAEMAENSYAGLNQSKSAHNESLELSPILKEKPNLSQESSESSPEKAFATPMPNYEKMLSPALRIELRKFGLKVIPRRKAVPLLKHIFQETHPECRRQVEFAQDELSSSQESSAEDLPEESILLNESGHERDNGDLHSRLIQFIKDDPRLHRQALMYEPIWLEDLVSAFKDKSSVTVKQAQIMDILDVECITFRTRAQHSKNSRKRKK